MYRKWPRRQSGVSRPISVKPDTCTERYALDPTDISVKVARITLGGPPTCLVLLASCYCRRKVSGWVEGVSRRHTNSAQPERLGPHPT